MNEHSNQIVADDQQPGRLRLIGLWPLGLYFAFCLILASNQEVWMRIVDEVENYTRNYFKRGLSGNQILSGVHFGQTMGVSSVLALIAGLCGLHAIRSIAIASILAVAIFLTLMFDMLNAQRLGRYSELFYAYNLPLMFFGAAIPLLVARAVSGAVITRQSKVDVTRRLSVESLLQLTTVVACLMIFCRVPMQLHRLTIAQVLPYLPGLLAMSALASLITVLPSVRWAFQSRFNWLRWILVVVISGLGISILCGAYSVLLGSWMGGGVFSFGPIGILVSVLFFMALYMTGIIALRASGYRWQKPKVACDRSFSESSDWSQRRTGWLWTGGFLLVAASTILPIQALKRYEKIRFQESIQWLTQLRVDGGAGSWYEGNIGAVRIPDKNTAYWFDEIKKNSMLGVVSFAGTDVGDEEIQQAIEQFPYLSWIDLSDTKITDRTVELLETAKYLNSVALSRTQVSADAIAKLLSNSRLRIQSVTLEDMQLNDEQFASLFSPQVSSWQLAGNNLTEKSLIKAYQNSANSLDVSRNPGTQAMFANLKPPLSFCYITIDQVDMDDVLLDQWLAKGPSGSVYLGRTSISIAGLAKLMEVFESIGFLPGGFDEQSLSKLTSTIVPKGITIRDPALTGDFLTHWPVLPAWLNVSGSSFSDVQLSKLAERADWRPGSLVLRGCKITDASLPLLSKLKLQTLDLTDTEVTFQGLLQSSFPNTRVIVEPENFTFDEMEQLKNRSMYIFTRHLQN